MLMVLLVVLAVRDGSSSPAACHSSLFDEACVVAMNQLQLLATEIFGTVTPYYLALVQLLHYCVSRAPMCARSLVWLGKIGKGGYATVFLVRRKDTGTTRSETGEHGVAMGLSLRESVTACVCMGGRFVQATCTRAR